MSLARSITYFGYRQAKNLIKFALGKPLVMPALSSMTLDRDDIQLARTWLTKKDSWYHSEEVEQYHARFAAWNGSAFAFSFMSGRVALSAVIHALGLKPDDEVILPGYTCVVVPNAFSFAQVRVVFSDIELDTFGLDAAQIETKITAKTKAILLHHIYGLVCRDYEEIIRLAREYDLYVIEDCTQSTGAEYKDRKIGNWGDAAIYSSEQSKVFNTLQGGIAVTNNAELAKRIQEYYAEAAFPDEEWIEKQLKHLILTFYNHKHPDRWWRGDLVRWYYRKNILISTTKEEEQGIRPSFYGRRLPAPIAAIGLNQLTKVDGYNEQRRQTAKRWDKWCETRGYQKPLVITDSTPVFLRYPILVEPERKADLSWAVGELGVMPGVWFLSQMHPVINCRIDGLPNADKAVRQCINLPTLL